MPEVFCGLIKQTELLLPDPPWGSTAAQAPSAHTWAAFKQANSIIKRTVSRAKHVIRVKTGSRKVMSS